LKDRGFPKITWPILPCHVSHNFIFSANSQRVSPCHDLARDHCSRSWGEWTPWKCHWLSPPSRVVSRRSPALCCELHAVYQYGIWGLWRLLSHLVTTAGSKYSDKEVSLTQSRLQLPGMGRTAYNW